MELEPKNKKEYIIEEPSAKLVARTEHLIEDIEKTAEAFIRIGSENPVVFSRWDE